MNNTKETSPPPPYQEKGKGAPPPVQQHANAQIETKDLQGRQMILLVDKSGSMSRDDMKPNDQTRWNVMQEAVLEFVDVMAKADPDGIDFCLFDERQNWYSNVGPEQIKTILSQTYPCNGTILAPPLQAAFELFFQRGKMPTIILVVSDGCPEDKVQVAETIAKASMKLKENGGKDSDLGVQFLQIGHDNGAAQFLQFLDDNIQEKYNAPFDIVDTKNMDQINALGGFKQVLIQAIND